MTRIWFNHWFSSVYYIIELMKRGEDDFYIIGSNAGNDAVYRLMCDEWYQEPDCDEDEYAEFCLEFCRTHSIDVFVPRRKMAAVSRNKNRFEEIGVRVMTDDYSIVEKLSSKSRTYEMLLENNIGDVPDYYTVTDAEGFMRAYIELRKKHERICFKYDQDEGAMSFRCIEEEKASGIDAVFRKRSTADEIAGAIAKAGGIRPLIVMPYLEGVEVSVDCLMTDSGPAMIPRYKDCTRIEKIRYDDYILDTCRRFLNLTGLQNPCNIQFKYSSGVPYFLEVNTRMSGGVHMSCEASGINIPNMAVNKILGNTVQWNENRREFLVTHVEKPLVL